jgi:tetratricopeptide (TPR) repeat protein
MPAQKPEAEAEGRARQGAGVTRPYARELLASLEALPEGEAGLAIGVWGPPGIGKSYAVRQALQGLPYPSYMLQAATPPARLPQRLPRSSDLPPWAKGTLARLAQEQPTSLQDTIDALAALLAAQAPVVLHVEDLHEVEGEGLELWTSLAGAVRGSPGVGLIVASRQMPPEVFAAQRPPPLTLEESWALLEAAGAALPADAVAWIYEHAAGNPLFTLEFLRFLRRQGNLWSDGRRWRWRAPGTLRIPANVETLISQTVRRAALDEDAKVFMWAKALLPADTPDALVAKVVTIDRAGLEEVKGQLGRGGILHGNDFVHPLYREVQAAALSPKNRARLAGRIVAALGPTHPESAAPFVGEAGLSGPAALDLLTRAAQAAAVQGRARQAGAWFVAAAGHNKGVKKRRLLLEAAHSLKDIRTAEATRLAEQVLEAEPDNVNAVLLLARCLVLQGEGERAEAVMHRLPERVRPSQRWFGELISLRTERSDYQGTVELWLSRPELQDAAITAAKRDAAYALMNLGRMEEAGALLVRTLALPELTDEEGAGLLEVQASIALFLGNYHDSLRLLDEVIALLRASDNPRIHQRLMYALRFRTMVYWGVCRLHEAVRDTEEAMRLASDLGSGRDYAIAQTYLGVSLTELGAYERAEEELLEAREVLVRSDAREHLAACEAMLGGVYVYWQPENAAAQALKYAYRSLNLTRELGAPVLICQAAIYAALAENTFGSGERGVALAQESLDIAMQIGQRRVVGTAYWVRGLAHDRLGEHEHALRDLNGAEHMLQELGLVGLATYAGLEVARLRNDWDKAREHVEVLRELGVVGYTLPARRHFAALFEA